MRKGRMRKALSSIVGTILIVAFALAVCIPVTVESEGSDYYVPPEYYVSTWTYNWDSSFEGDYIVLKKYKGEGGILNIPEKVNIDGRVYKVKLADDCSGMFAGKSSVVVVTFDHNIDTSNVTNLAGMFSGCQRLQHVDISGFDTSRVTSMQGMFQYCMSLTSLDVSNFNTENCTDFSLMFTFCDSLGSLDISRFDTSKATNMKMMFWHCIKLNDLDLSGFNICNVTDMSRMFANCNNLKSIDLSNLDARNVTDMQAMFSGCSCLESINFENFKIEKIENMNDLFSNCSSLKSLDLSSFDMSNTSSVNFSSMFSGCNDLKYIMTPLNVNVDIQLPVTYVNCYNDEEEYTHLPKNQSESLIIINPDIEGLLPELDPIITPEPEPAPELEPVITEEPEPVIIPDSDSQPVRDTNSYAVKFGEDQIAKTGEEIVFSVDADYSLFVDGGKVYVDGVLLPKTAYASRSGSTVITLLSEYTANLNSGLHSLEIRFNNGKIVNTSFTIAGAINEKTATVNQTAAVDSNLDNKNVSDTTNNKTTSVVAPKTGDAVSALIIGIAVIIMIICVSVFIRKRA